MGSGASLQPLETKTWQIVPSQEREEGYLYYCCLCDEALILSKDQVNPRKIILALENCPGCGFELDRVLRCERSWAPIGERFFVNPKCKVGQEILGREQDFRLVVSRGTSLLRDPEPKITTGIEILDRTLTLGFGQLVALLGEASHSLSLLLCARAALPPPLGVDSDVIFVDGGNLFDSYKVSQHSRALGSEPRKVKGRIHLSRAFTHHQLYSLTTEKLPHALEEYGARLTVISDMTLLYCDPDVKDRREALDLFTKNIRFLVSLAEQREALILVTNLESRNRSMERVLLQFAHVSGRLKDRGTFTQLQVAKHLFASEQEVGVVSFENQTLGTYL